MRGKLFWYIWFILAILAALLFIGKNLFRSTVLADIEKPANQEISQLDCENYITQELEQCGWNRSTIKAVYDLNKEYLDQIYELGKDVLEKECLTKWRRLGGFEYQKALESDPVLVSLLASVLDVDAEGAKNIIQTIPPDEDGKIVIYDIYQLYAEPEAAARVAILLQDSTMRDYMIRLINHSPHYVNLLDQLDYWKTLQDENKFAGDIYRQWLCSIFDDLLNSEPESVEEQQNLTYLDFFSERVRLQLKNGEETFRDSFLDYWEQFKDILQQIDGAFGEDAQIYSEGVCEYYSWDPRVFEFLHKYRDLNAVELYTLYGSIASSMLLSPEYLVPENNNARKKLVNLMLTGNEDIRQNFVCTYMKCLANDPAFVGLFLSLLEKPLTDHAFYCMVGQLSEAASPSSEKTPYQLVEYWKRLDNDVLESEFSEKNPGLIAYIPGCDAARLVIRMSNGQTVTGWDVAFAGVDAAFLVFDVGGVLLAPVTGGGPVVVSKTLRSGIKFAAKATAKTTIEPVSKDLIKQNASGCMRVMKKVYSKFSKDLKELAKGHIPITDLVKFSFRRSKLGRKMYKKYTGLEARSFMRNDRRVFIDLGKVIETPPGKIIKNLMADTLVGAGLATVIQTDAGQKTVIIITDQAKMVSRSTDEVRRAWHQNLSLWWTLNQKQ